MFGSTFTPSGDGISRRYSPILTPVLNVNVLTLNGTFIYSKISNGVIVCGSVSVTPAAVGDVQFRMSLPVNSNFDGTSYDLSGNATSPGATGLWGSVIATGTGTSSEALCVSYHPVGGIKFYRLFFQYSIK